MINISIFRLLPSQIFEYSLENMDATEVNWEPILEMLPTQDLDDYDERMK